MWPFAKRRARVSALEKGFPGPAPKLALEAFAENDAVLRVWLPERLVESLDLLCAEFDSSRPDVVRWILFRSMFGVIEALHLERHARETRRRLNASGRPARYLSAGHLEGSRVRFSRGGSVDEDTPAPRLVTMRLLGKSLHDMTLHLPTAMRDQLTVLAGQHQKPLSEFVRETLARELLGFVFYTEWQTRLREAGADEG